MEKENDDKSFSSSIQSEVDSISLESTHQKKQTVIIAARTFGYDQEQSSPTQDNTIGEPIEKDGESGCESTWNPNLEKEPDKQQRKYLEVENEDEDIELIIDANRIPVLNRAIKKVVWPHVKFFNGDYELQEYKKGSLGDLLCKHIGVPEEDRSRYWNQYWDMVPKLLGRHRSDCTNYMKQAFMGKFN